ncbi:MAG TPA: hypothetical protein VG269_21005 [Tepidisphaeraceae bacterium]|jgi:hypothetical protein|nr:hypothetical protein [Tepidisphaeraceae bacterium]
MNLSRFSVAAFAAIMLVSGAAWAGPTETTTAGSGVAALHGHAGANGKHGKKGKHHGKHKHHKHRHAAQ